jgi:hypothetical protein
MTRRRGRRGPTGSCLPALSFQRGGAAAASPEARSLRGGWAFGRTLGAVFRPICRVSFPTFGRGQLPRRCLWQRRRPSPGRAARPWGAATSASLTPGSGAHLVKQCRRPATMMPTYLGRPIRCRQHPCPPQRHRRRSAAPRRSPSPPRRRATRRSNPTNAYHPRSRPRQHSYRRKPRSAQAGSSAERHKLGRPATRQRAAVTNVAKAESSSTGSAELRPSCRRTSRADTARARQRWVLSQSTTSARSGSS